MYREDQPKISHWARQSPDNMAKCMHFVIMTIQQQLNVAVSDCLDLSGNQVSLWGFKRKAYYEILERKQSLYDDLEAMYSASLYDDMLALLTTVHGFGLVKAGFVLQLCYGISGCIDSHNLARLGISPNTVKIGSNVLYKTRIRRAKEYHALLKQITPKNTQNTTEWLWDSWCKWVAKMQPNSYNSADHVSKLHLMGTIGHTI